MSGGHTSLDAVARANKKLEELGLPLLPGSKPSEPEPKPQTANDKTRS